MGKDGGRRGMGRARGEERERAGERGKRVVDGRGEGGMRALYG